MWTLPMRGIAEVLVRAAARAGRRLALGSVVLAWAVAPQADAAAAAPDAPAPEVEAPVEPGPGAAPEPDAAPQELGPEPGAVPESGEAEPEPGADGSRAAEPVAAADPAAFTPRAEPVAAAEPADAGALPSGHAKTDDGPVDEAQLERDRRAGRRLRSRERDEGHWQVFAPYPELGPIRYRDPEGRRTLWLGLDAAGTYLPSSLGLSNEAVWAVRPAGAWAFALTPWLALGGRHEVEWYDAGAPRIRVHGHQVELSSRPLQAARSTDAVDDRLALGVTTHAIRGADGTTAAAGGSDTILHLGYGLDHLLGTRWRLGWHAQARHAWLPRATQRQVRLSTRVAFNPRPAHRLALDAVGYYVNRDAEAAGDAPLPRHSVHGQLGLGYAWMGQAGVGPWTHVRATSHFRSGEAPIYETRDESLDGAYGEVLVGMMARWP